jgi:S1-C subfamily serine protease
MNRLKYAALLAVFIITFVASHALAAPANEEALKRAVVKVFTVSSDHNYYTPWRMNEPRRQTGSGCVIAGGRILTNAHVVSDAKYIQIQLYGDSERYNARVVHIAHEADLALLVPLDPAVLAGIEPLEVGGLPRTLDEVMVYGYPLGGNTLSITKGVLSRIEFQTYAHSGSYFLAGQIDAAINPGNSGGPVVAGGEIVGISMQKQSSNRAENIGYMIPSPVIRHVLDDVSDGRYDGFPMVGFTYQDMESPSMRDKYNMGADQTGVLVTNVGWNSPAQKALKAGDVILSVDEHTIANDGTVELRTNERVAFTYYVHLHQTGDDVAVRVLRDGKEIDLTIPLSLGDGSLDLVLSLQHEKEPTFFVFGGLVFMPLSENYLCTWKNCNAPVRLMKYLDDFPNKDRLELAVLTRVMPASVNEGYHDMGNIVIDLVNGKRYRDFAEFFSLVTQSKSEFLTLTTPTNVQVVLNRKQALATLDEILDTYGITKDHSDDVSIQTKAQGIGNRLRASLE